MKKKLLKNQLHKISTAIKVQQKSIQIQRFRKLALYP